MMLLDMGRCVGDADFPGKPGLGDTQKGLPVGQCADGLELRKACGRGDRNKGRAMCSHGCHKGAGGVQGWEENP